MIDIKPVIFFNIFLWGKKVYKFVWIPEFISKESMACRVEKKMPFFLTAEMKVSQKFFNFDKNSLDILAKIVLAYPFDKNFVQIYKIHPVCSTAQQYVMHIFRQFFAFIMQIFAKIFRNFKSCNYFHIRTKYCTYKYLVWREFGQVVLYQVLLLRFPTTVLFVHHRS